VTPSDRIILFGAAGLVGQNLVVLLKQEGFTNLVCIDKHPANTAMLRRLHPELEVIEADMAQPGVWEDACAGAQAAVMLQAQIGGDVEDAFRANNITATGLALAALRRAAVPYLVHISSSVVNSAAQDWYTETKAAQEALVVADGIAHCVLRPTLMFGAFDRKHLGWLSRFMQRMPVFPIPGDGRYLRQPLYARDFCRIILACLRQQKIGAYNITGRERITYVDIIRAIKRATGARARIVHIPYWSFWCLLKLYGLVKPDAPFTTKQLQALATPDEFELIPWWDIFGTVPTPFAEAVNETFGPNAYAAVVLEF
jgi:nucleoside-diphosphate-sugar epimerase